MANSIPENLNTLVEVSEQTLRQIEDIRALMARLLPDAPSEFTLGQQRSIIIGVAVLKLWMAFESFKDAHSSAGKRNQDWSAPDLADFLHLFRGESGR